MHHALYRRLVNIQEGLELVTGHYRASLQIKAEFSTGEKILCFAYTAAQGYTGGYKERFGTNPAPHN